MAKTKQNGIRKPDNVIIGLGNNKEITILDSNRLAGEAFSKTPYASKGIDGNGNESINVDLLNTVDFDRNNLQFNMLEVAGKEIELKVGMISLGKEDENGNKEKEYVFLYDNRTKEIAQAYKKGQDGKLQRIDADEFIIEPKLKGKTLEERIQTVDNLLIQFLLKGFNSKDKDLSNAIQEAISNSLGNLRDKKVDPAKINTLRDKTIFTQEVISKLDLNNSTVKNFYMELREDYSELPSLKQLKDKNFLNQTFTQVGITGIDLKNFRKLTKTEDMLNEYSTLSEIDEFKEIQALKDELNLKTNVINTNTTYVGINERGEISVFENKAIKTPSNGQIYKDYKLAEKLKDDHIAIGTIKKAIFNPDEIEKDKVVKAENILKENVSKLLENETDSRLKTAIDNLVKSVDSNQLYATDNKEKYQMFNKFEEMFNYIKKRVTLETEKEVYENMDILTKKKDRISNISYAYKPVEKVGGFDKTVLENPDDIKDVKEYLMLAYVPTLSSFEGKGLFTKNKPVIAASLYFNENNNEILQVNKGAKLDNAFNMLNLGKMIDNVRNYKEGEEETTKKFKDIHNGIMKYFYLNKDENSIQTSENFQKSIEFVKPELSKLVELLKENKYNEAKELVNTWDNSEDKNLRTFAKWSKDTGENYENLKMFRNVYYALSLKDEALKQKVNTYLAKPNLDNLEDLITTKKLSKFRQPLTAFVKEMTKGINNIIYQKQKNVEELNSLNGGVEEERLKYASLEKIASNIAFSVTNFNKIYYTDKNGEVKIPNTVDRSFRKDVNDANIVQFKKVEFNGKEVQVADLNQDALNNHLEKAEKNQNEVNEALEVRFEKITAKAAERLSYVKDESVGESISFSGINFNDEGKENVNVNVSETTEELPKDEIETEETEMMMAEEELPLDDLDIDIPEENLDGTDIAAKEEVNTSISFSGVKAKL